MILSTSEEGLGRGGLEGGGLERDELYRKLEELGEDEVRTLLAGGRTYGEKHRGLVEDWIRKKEQERESHQQSRADDRADEHLEIAKGVFDNSTNMKRIAATTLFLGILVALAGLVAWLWNS